MIVRVCRPKLFKNLVLLLASPSSFLGLHPWSQLSLLTTAGRQMSISQSATMLCSWRSTKQNGSFRLWINLWAASKTVWSIVDNNATLSALETGIALIVRRHARVSQETCACIRWGQDPPRGGSVEGGGNVPVTPRTMDLSNLSACRTGCNQCHAAGALGSSDAAWRRHYCGHLLRFALS